MLNENGRLHAQLDRMKAVGADVDIVIADGGSNDGSVDEASMRARGPAALGGRCRAQYQLQYSRRTAGLLSG